MWLGYSVKTLQTDNAVNASWKQQEGGTMHKSLAAGAKFIACVISLATLGCDVAVEDHHEVCFEPPPELISLCNTRPVPVFVPEIQAVLGPGQCTVVDVSPALVCEGEVISFEADVNDFAIELADSFPVVIVGTTIFID